MSEGKPPHADIHPMRVSDLLFYSFGRVFYNSLTRLKETSTTLSGFHVFLQISEIKSTRNRHFYFYCYFLIVIFQVELNHQTLVDIYIVFNAHSSFSVFFPYIIYSFLFSPQPFYLIHRSGRLLFLHHLFLFPYCNLFNII